MTNFLRPNGRRTTFKALALTRVVPVAALAAIAAGAVAQPGSATESAPKVTGTVSVNRPTPSTSLVSGAITTKTSNQLLVAFLAVDGARDKQSLRSVVGCGVAWSLVVRANAQHGAAEIWQARAKSALTKCVVTAKVQAGAQRGSATLMSFSDGVVASKVSASGATGNPKARIQGKEGSLLFGVGVDADGAARRAMPRGQSVVAQQLASTATTWIQRAGRPMPKTATVTLGASEPKGHRWNFAAVEIRRGSADTLRIRYSAASRRLRPSKSPTQSAPTSAAPTPTSTAPASTAPAPAPVSSSAAPALAPAPSTTAPAPSTSAAPVPAATLSLSTNTPATTSLGVAVVSPGGTDSVRLGWTEAGTGRAWNAVYPVGRLPVRLTGLIAATDYDVYAAAIDNGVEAHAVHVEASTASATSTPTTSAPAPAPSSSTPAPAPTSSAPAPSAPAPTTTIPAGSRNATNTGVPAGTVLRPSGALTVTVAGTVIDSLDISGGVVIKAPNVVIRRSRLTGSTGYGVQVIDGGSVVIEDTEIAGFQNGIAFANWVGRRLNIHGQKQDGVKAHSNTTLEDSWIHDLLPEPDAHADALQMQGGSSNLIIRRNLIDCRGAGQLGNAAIFLKPDFGSGSGPVLVEGNVLAGGNYTLYHMHVNGNTQSGVTIRGNRFKRGTWNYGPLYVTSPSAWSDNAYEDGTPIGNPVG